MNRWVLVACATAMTIGTVEAAAAVLVVRSSGPSAKIYAMGKALPDNSKITLKANDTVTLLDSRGTRTIRGPGTFDVSASSGGSTSALSALSGTTARRRTVGASRGGEGRSAPTGATAGRNIWQADISRSGNVCVVDGSDAGIYRANADTAGIIAIKDTGSGQTANVDFAAGQRNASWPEGLPLVAGHNYEVSNGSSKVKLTAKALGNIPAGMEGLAQSLIVNGCDAQLDVLVDTLTPPSAG
jgi:hypothetical protein